MPFLEKKETYFEIHNKIKSNSKQKLCMTSKTKTQQTSHSFGY